MSQIEIKLTVQAPKIGRNDELPIAANNPLPEILPTATGNENGAIFFNLDWLNQQAESRRQQIADSLLNNNLFSDNSDESHNFQPNLIETAHNLDPEKVIDKARADLFEPTKDGEEFEQMRRQPETIRREIRQTVEPQKKEVEVKNQPKAQTNSRFDEQVAQMKNAGLTTQEFAQTLPHDEQAAFLARFQLSENLDAKNVRELLDKIAPQTLANNKNQGEKPLANPNFAEIAPTKIAEENTFAAKTLPAKFVSANPNEAPAKSEFVAREANNFAPKLANGSLILNETSAARIANQQNSDTAQNNSALQRETNAAVGGALINGSQTSVEDFPQLENIQIGDSSSGSSFYGSAEGFFAAGATGVMMSAAIGSVVPSAHGAVSGVLGFVSGVVVGIEADQGLRWLSSNKSDAGNYLLETKIDESRGENLSLQLEYA